MQPHTGRKRKRATDTKQLVILQGSVDKDEGDRGMKDRATNMGTKDYDRLCLVSGNSTRFSLSPGTRPIRETLAREAVAASTTTIT